MRSLEDCIAMSDIAEHEIVAEAVYPRPEQDFPLARIDAKGT
jgi:hypothetical protein